MASTTLERPEKFEIGRVFNNSFAVIGRNIGLCLGLALLFSGLPAIILRLWSQPQIDAVLQGDPGAAADPSMMFTVIAGLLSFVFALLLQSALVRATIEDLNGKRPTFGDCIQIAIRNLLPTLGIG
ncbi:MAG: hypothetical protein E5W81_27170, partial [Mesorhizobium sp.]